MNFKEIYQKYLNIFKEKIRDEFVEKIFHKDKDRRILLKVEHTKSNQEPEALTSDIIKEMLRECGIDPLDISREFIISGKDTTVLKKIKKKPDFYLESKDEELNKHLLFEIEALNKELLKEGDGEGVEQANEWYNVKKPLFLQFNTIITNFLDWYLLYYDFETKDLELSHKKPWEMLRIIADVKFSRGREYSHKEVEQKKAITTKFYNGFQERLNKLLNTPSKIKIPIEIRNFKKPLDMTKEDYEQNQTDFYRTIFSRLLFIKILESWKILPFDPIQNGILKEDKSHWANDLRVLFFDIFNKQPKNRPSEIQEIFKKLPYLNGGLFRPCGIELDTTGSLRDVYLNPDAIKDIWDFFNKYRFVEMKEWSNYHMYNDHKTQISFQLVSDNLLTVQINDYSIKLKFEQIEILKLLLKHLLKEKIIYATSSHTTTEKQKFYEEKDKKRLIQESEKTEIKGSIKGQTDKAILIKFKGDQEVWVPKSAIHSKLIDKIGIDQSFLIENWVLEKNKILD